MQHSNALVSKGENEEEEEVDEELMENDENKDIYGS